MRGTVSGLLVVVLCWGVTAGDLPSRAQFYAERLKDDSVTVRRTAARSLAALGDPATVPVLLEGLSDADARVRAQSARALGLIGDTAAVTGLVALLSDSDANVRFYSAYSLGEIGDRSAVDALLPLLDDPVWLVRDQAAWALRKVAEASVAVDLVPMLADDQADIKHLQWLLVHVAPRESVPGLVELLEHEDKAVRLRVVDTLGRLHQDDTLEPLLVAAKDSSPDVRLAAIEQLLAIGDDSLDAVFRKLAAGDPDSRVREAAEEAVLVLALRGDLVAYWSFDDKNLKTATDVTRRGIDGQIVGCTVAPGKSGAALAFADGAHIELGKPPEMPIGQRALTIMAWAKSSAANGVVVARGGAFCGFSLYIKDGVPKFGIHRFEDGPGYIAAGEETVVGRWVHLAGVIREDRIDLFVDGKLAGSTKTEGYLPGDCGQGMEIGFDAGNSPAEITDHFVGVIDEVKVFHAAFGEQDLVKHCKLED